jgi:hypothetical protein
LFFQKLYEDIVALFSIKTGRIDKFAPPGDEVGQRAGTEVHLPGLDSSAGHGMLYR